MVKCLPHITNGSAQMYLVRIRYLQAHRHPCAEFVCPGSLNAHEGLGRNVKEWRETKDRVDGAPEALRDIWSLQARESIGAANQPAC